MGRAGGWVAARCMTYFCGDRACNLRERVYNHDHTQFVCGIHNR